MEAMNPSGGGADESDGVHLEASLSPMDRIELKDLQAAVSDLKEVEINTAENLGLQEVGELEFLICFEPKSEWDVGSNIKDGLFGKLYAEVSLTPSMDIADGETVYMMPLDAGVDKDTSENISAEIITAEVLSGIVRFEFDGLEKYGVLNKDENTCSFRFVVGYVPISSSKNAEDIEDSKNSKDNSKNDSKKSNSSTEEENAENIDSEVTNSAGNQDSGVSVIDTGTFKFQVSVKDDIDSGSIGAETQSIEALDTAEDSMTFSDTDAADAVVEAVYTEEDTEPASGETSKTIIKEIAGGTIYDNLTQEAESDNTEQNPNGDPCFMKVYEVQATANVQDSADQEVMLGVSLSDKAISEIGCLEADGTVTGVMEVIVRQPDGSSTSRLIPGTELMASKSVTNGEPIMTLSLDAPLATEGFVEDFYSVEIYSRSYVTLNAQTATNPYLSYVAVGAGGDLTIDLNGYTWTRDFTEYPDFDLSAEALKNLSNPVYASPQGAAYHPYAYVRSGGKLTIRDSRGGGGIYAEGLQAIITLQRTDADSSKRPRLVIDCPDSTKIINNGGHHVIFTEDAMNWGNVLDSYVDMRGGTLSGATGETLKGWAGSWAAEGFPDDKGGGILAGEVRMTGGVIEGCIAKSKGGGICANTVTIRGGTIRDCQAGGLFYDGWGKGSYGWGGGIAGVRVNIRSDARIENNRASYAGGGVFGYCIVMSGGTVSSNSVRDSFTDSDLHVRGGGGIYVGDSSRIISDGWDMLPGAVPNCTLRQDTIYGMDGLFNFNFEFTGGTVSDNISDHTGGGIFINNGAKGFIRAETSPIRITGNQALDIMYIYGIAAADPSKPGHGYGGGGIFVEHEFAGQGGYDAHDGGYLCCYGAVITDNTARYGAGTAGCGTSDVTITATDGPVITGNYLTEWPDGWKLKNGIIKGQETANGREPNPTTDVPPDFATYGVDIVAHGSGVIDDYNQLGHGNGWVGTICLQPNVSTPYTGHSWDQILKDSKVKLTRTYGFALKSAIPDSAIAEAIDTMGVNISGNYSGSGGGGVGGNGVICYGRGPVIPTDEDVLEIKKDVGSDLEKKWDYHKEDGYDFRVRLVQVEYDEDIMEDIYTIRQTANLTVTDPNGTQSTQIAQTDRDGWFNIKVKAGGSAKFFDLKTGTLYFVEESRLPEEMYKQPNITAEGGRNLLDGSKFEDPTVPEPTPDPTPEPTSEPTPEPSPTPDPSETEESGTETGGDDLFPTNPDDPSYVEPEDPLPTDPDDPDYVEPEPDVDDRPIWGAQGAVNGTNTVLYINHPKGHITLPNTGGTGFRLQAFGMLLVVSYFVCATWQRKKKKL